MKKLYSRTASNNKSSIELLFIAIILTLSVVEGYAQVPFAPRTASSTPTQEVYSIKGDFAMIGNANLKLVNYSDTADNDDPMEYVDIDGITSTINSSSATLQFSTENGAVPECSNILYAGLYWVGRADSGSDPNLDGDNNPNTFTVTHNGNPKPLNKAQVLLKGPGDTNYITIPNSGNPATEINFPTGGDVGRNIYVGYSEITSIVQARGLGEYTVADIALREGSIDVTGYSGGWGMVVVYENSKMKWRDVTVFDGYAFVGAGGLPQTISASGFQAAQSGDVNLKLGVMASEGEVGWDGDFFAIQQRNNPLLFVPLSHSENSTTNFFNSTILVDNNQDSVNDPRNETRQNNAGLDIAVFNIDNGNDDADPLNDNFLIDNGQTSTTFQYGTFDDSYAIFNVTFAVDAYVPESEGVIANTSINGNPPGANPSLEPSENADFTIEIKNTGTEAINNAVITLPLSDSVDPTNLNITYNTYLPFTTPNVPIYDASIGTNGGIVWDLGNLPMPVDPNTVLADLSFTTTVTTNCSILSDPTFDPNVSVSGIISGEGATSGVPFNTDLILGYETEGSCIGEPITGPLQIPVEFLDYVNSPPTASNPEPINLECTDTIPDPDINVVTDEVDNSGIPPIVTWLEPDVSDNGTCTEIITRTYRVTDDCGNFIDVEQTITITTPAFTIADADGGSTVECIADATETFTLPTVTDACGNTLSPSAAVVTETPDPLTCEGTRTYAYTYEDCAGNTDTWEYTYTIDTPAFTIADADGGSTVECIADATETFTLPTVTDACGNTLSPSAAVVTEDPDPLTCEGTRTYVYTYEDCAGNTDTWEYTYTIELNEFTMPANGNQTVSNLSDATEPVPPTVLDNCGNELTPSEAEKSETPDCQGSVIYTFTYEDCAENTAEWTYTYTVELAPFTVPDSETSTVNCIDEAVVPTPPSINDANGNNIVPLMTENEPGCEDDKIYTFTYTDCANNTGVWTYTYVFDLPTINYNEPSDLDIISCNFEDQEAIGNAFTTWVNEQTDAIAVSGGCDPQLSNNSSSVAIPQYCDGGSATVTWTITDRCQNITLSADFNLEAQQNVEHEEPKNETVNACDFYSDDPIASQEALDNAIAEWVIEQTELNESTLIGGCSPTVSHNFADQPQSIDLCTGGAIIVTWSINDFCQGHTHEATYTVVAPEALTYDTPQDDDSTASEFDDPDANVAQQNLDDDIAAWVAAQNDAITNSFDGGCNPIVTNDFTDQSISFCTSGSIEITWTIEDLCGTTQIKASYTFTQPDGISFTNPSTETVDTCDFFNEDPQVAQNGLDTAIADWVTEQTDIITNSLSGGSPDVTHDYSGATIDLCQGGSITVNWSIEDICETINVSASYSVVPADSIVYTAPTDLDAQSCDYADQSEVDTAFNNWVAAQTASFGITGGCSPVLTDNSANAAIPQLCDGGTATVTWTITDLCETINVSADFELIAPTAVAYNEPTDLDVQSCDYADQDEVDAAFNNWVAAQTAIIAPTNGCSPILTNNSASASIPQLCVGGTATVIWTITDLCETNIEVSADFEVTAPTAVSYNEPTGLDAQSCDYADQNEVDAAFNDWVAAQTVIIAPTNGCNPILTNNSASTTIPQLCAGGTSTVTWTITDLCETINVSADFELTAPTAVSYNDPVDLDVQSCDYADQNEMDTVFNNWVAAQTAAFATNGGCSPVLTDNSATTAIPQLCDGGTATVTWTITDLCETINVSADFELTAPTVVSYNDPADLDVQSCDYADQNEVDTAFNNWVAAQTAAFTTSGGCSPVLTDNSATTAIPQLCAGGTATVTWTITDLCETINVSADFELTAPTAVTYDAPQNDSSTASEFDDPDANVAQQNLDDDIAAWVAAQNDAITNSLTGGCAPTVTNDFTDQSLSFCTSGSITITWTVEDLCGTTNPTATYTYTQPDGISFTNPSSETVDTCDFFNEDPLVAQNGLDTAIADWVNEQTEIITNSLSGGSPDVTHDYSGATIDLCQGGSITVNWSIEDICETINVAATYTVAPADAIAYTAPSDLDAQSCDYADQSEVDNAFNNWVTAQTTALGITGGCSPTLADNSANATIPQLCDGGTATVTWTITDLCETINVSADFTITPTATATFTNPTDDTSDACEFGTDDLVSAQQNLDADLLAWVNTQTQNINDSFSGGCSPMVSNDFENQTIDFCTGGAITINWEITDLCDTINVSATYTYTAPQAPAFVQNLPTDITVECDAVPTADALTASNSCGVIDVTYTEDRTDGDCPSTYTLLRTWSATNICGVTTTHQQTITVQDTTPPVLTLPDNVTAECSDDLTPIAFGEATATDNCDANPIITYEDNITNGACPGDYTIIRTWMATDACGNVATADQTISTSDTTAPVFDQTNLPGNVVVECTGVPEPEILTATDNCGTAVVTVEDVRTDENCPGNYVITRSYTATDECGITNTHVQTITVQDTTPPVFVEDFPLARIVVECDAIPTPETLTATDSCGSATVSVSDTRTDGTCPNSYTLARTWTAEDECGLTTTFTQIITVQDTTPPTFMETLPRDITVECDAIPDVASITATDNCGDAVVTVNDVRTDGSCPNSYTIARTYTATDECDLTTTHTQIITVQDTTAPMPTTAYEETINASCIDIEAAPELEFADNCSTNVIVEFEETSTFEEGVFADYQVIRTWTVRDACSNEAVYTQTVNVTLDEIYTEVNAQDRCFDDGQVNLRGFLSDSVTSGTWEIIEGNPIATIEGDIFDPTNLEDAYTEEFNPNTEGITYLLRFTGFEDGCMNVTDVTMVIDAKCKVLPCGESDVIISKAITPNNDGFNDTFDIAGIDLCGFIAEVKIFNRWGALVYESNNYTLGSIKTSGAKGDWDGSSPSASFGNAGKLPNGTYYYIINLRDSGLSPLTGPIYLGTK